MNYRDHLRIWESDYGRSDGWDVELDGKLVALLDEPQFEDMFWYSYRLSVTADDPTLKERMLTAEFWKGDDCLRLVCRSRATGFVVEHPLPAPGFNQSNRVLMRFLYISIRDPLPWDWIVLKFRKVFRSSFKRQTHKFAK
ncbi:hypothetical protein [Anatilimnocola floriformis]|uniref:hypothetical protein n=1 Tax=Anatilimnocola floriformis TaxID=2948575 RepID=UPI0020C208D9|nr:hypothetical protein [Anatilimnocola floriformis]